jgi:hypothetical protein
MGAEAARKAAADAYADLSPRMKELRTEGLTLQAIAEKLNLEGHTTRRGRPWSPVQVSRILDRMVTSPDKSQSE